MGRHWLLFLLIATLHPDLALAAGMENCGTTDTTLSTSSHDAPVPARFYPYRVGVLGVAMTARDVQFQWDSLYVGGMTPTVHDALRQFLTSLTAAPALSPVATDAFNLQAVYDYTHQEPVGVNWNPNDPGDSTSLRVGYGFDDPPAGGNNLDRSHVDTYIFHPDRTSGEAGLPDGAFPSRLLTDDEDEDTGHDTPGDVLHTNSIMFKGPHPNAAGDLSTTGWTGPGSVQRIHFNHELQHGTATFSGGNSGWMGEFRSAVAEAVGGVPDTSASSEVPYTWPLNSRLSPGAEPPTIRIASNNYQARTSFACYLAYNFLGTNTTRTLAGMTDDLLYKWMKLETRSFPTLADLLTDTDCGTCFSKTYLHAPGGAPIAPRERMMLIHHNWRVANFVNQPSLAEGQFGYPAFGGFSPGRNQRAWQAFDPYATDDIVALPAIRVVTKDNLLKDLVLKGDRSFRGNTYPMTLVPYAANYWVLRAHPDLQATDRDLVIRIAPNACYHCKSPLSNELGDARLMASAVAYTASDPGTIEESLLWKYPATAALATPVQTIIADSTTGSLELVIPNFGTTHKAVVVVLTAADGQFTKFMETDDLGYKEVLPYRLEVGVRGAPFALNNPAITTETPSRQDREPTWSPDGQSIAFTVVNGPSGTGEIWKRQVDMNAVNQPAAVRLVMGPNKASAPDWSPAGDWIAYSSDSSPSESGIWKISPSGGTAVPLTTLSGRESMPVFQPNGQGLAYLHQAPSSPERTLRWASVDGTVDFALASLGAMTTERRPQWSPDGAKVMISLESGADAIYSVPKTGGALTLETAINFAAANFDLPPGSGRPVFASRAAFPNFARVTNGCTASPVSYPAGRLALLDAAPATRDTSYRFVRPGFVNDHPRISPDGTRVVYQAEDPTTMDCSIAVGQFTWNHAPTYSNLPTEIGVTACIPFQITLLVNEPDGESVTYKADYLPSGATLGTPTANVFRWQHPSVGTYHVVFRVLDGSGGVAHRVVRLNVVGLGDCHDPLEEGDGGYCPSCLTTARTFGATVSGAAATATAPDQTNSYMNGALPGAWFSNLARVARYDYTTDGDVSVGLRAMLTGETALDRARLIAVDHPLEATALATSGGVRVGRLQALPQLLAASGGDISAALSAAAAEGRPLTVAAGSTITASWSAADGIVGLALDCARVGAAVWDTESGIEVLLLQGGTWTRVDRVSPRRGFDWIGSSVPDATQARFVFDSDTQLRSLQGLVEPGEWASAINSQEAAATGSDRESAVAALAEADGSALRLAKHESVSFVFPVSATTPGSARSYFLSLRAAYTPPTGAWSARLHPAGPNVPTRFSLLPNRPNPFTTGTTFRFDVPQEGPVRIEVFDAMGRRVTTLVDGSLAPGAHAYDWDGRDQRGALVGPGVYLYRMTAGAFTAQRRLVLLPR